MTRSILLVGVGGQGTILTSKILAQGLIELGYDVKMSEIHGMSQRGGSVNTQIRFGKKVHSPMIAVGEADTLVAFEKTEAVRHLSFLKPHGNLIVNDYEIYSLPVLLGKECYPQDVIQRLKNTVKNTTIINAAQIAQDIGNIKAQNMVLFGAVVKKMGLDDIDWIEIMKQNIHPRFHELNIRAFNEGMKS